MKGITARQQTVLEIIARIIKERGYPPTLQDLTDALGASSRNTAVKHLVALAKKGYILWEKNKARGIRLIKPMGLLDSEEEMNLPLVGAVTAGSPMLAEQNIERYVPVPRFLVRNTGSHFLLRVKGHSMKDAGLLDRDLVVVRSQNSADTGEVVVALIGGEATVKRLASDNGRQYLKAENPEYVDIHPESEWNIQGRVVALLRESVE
jgi:repressor LexA